MPCLFGKIELLCDRAPPRGQKNAPVRGQGRGWRRSVYLPRCQSASSVETSRREVPRLTSSCRNRSWPGAAGLADSTAKRKAAIRIRMTVPVQRMRFMVLPSPCGVHTGLPEGTVFPLPLPLYNTRIFIHIAHANVKCLLKSAAPLLRIRLQPGYPKFHARKNAPPALLPAGRCHSEIYLWISREWKQHGRIRQFCRPHE